VSVAEVRGKVCKEVILFSKQGHKALLYTFMTKRILITGSTTGLGLIAGELLTKLGHDVVLHARSKSSKMNKALTYLIGDFSKPEEVKSVADEANKLGRFDSVIHNAGVYTASPKELFSVNVLAPYLLSNRLTQPERMIFMSSGMHRSGQMNLEQQKCKYSDTKLFDLMLAKWFARQWPGTFINAVDPGWVPTRMGGASAPDDLVKGAQTQVWLATSDEPAALVTGKYFHHKEQQRSNLIADDEGAQEKLIEYLGRMLSNSE
jgi:NAD(P)-dependent dehydrogenase (short-subunit alcohol dehydrogenase family)